MCLPYVYRLTRLWSYVRTGPFPARLSAEHTSPRTLSGVPQAWLCEFLWQCPVQVSPGRQLAGDWPTNSWHQRWLHKDIDNDWYSYPDEPAWTMVLLQLKLCLVSKILRYPCIPRTMQTFHRSPELRFQAFAKPAVIQHMRFCSPSWAIGFPV